MHTPAMKVGHQLVADYEQRQGRSLVSMESGWDESLPGVAAITVAANKRAAGRAGSLSADYVSYNTDHQLDRLIEVKTKERSGTSFGLLDRQVKTARLLREWFWLYVPFDCATEHPRLAICYDVAALIETSRYFPSQSSAKRSGVTTEGSWHAFVDDVIEHGQLVFG